MKKVSTIVASYYDEMIQRERIVENSFRPRRALPIKAIEKSKWYKKENPRRLCREYKLFGDKYNNFINDILDLQSDLQHHAKIILEYPLINIEVWTHDISEITEIDQKWARRADQIFRGYK